MTMHTAENMREFFPAVELTYTHGGRKQGKALREDHFIASLRRYHRRHCKRKVIIRFQPKTGN